MKLNIDYNSPSQKRYDIFTQIDSQFEKKGATLKKTVFHIHTPESHDYGLWSKKDLLSIKQTDIDNFINHNNMQNINFDKDSDTYQEIVKSFNNFIEFQLFCLMIQRCNLLDITNIVVTDHNTFSGYYKLNKAAKYLYEEFNFNYPCILKGIEISCSDQLHIVVIINEDDQNMRKKADEWVSEYIINDEVGTYLPSLMVLDHFYQIGAIGYIAHLNSSDIFKKDKYLNKQYKTKLFNLNNMKVIGLSNLDKEKELELQLKNLKLSKKFSYILDEDSHTIGDLGKKPMWLKTSKFNFNSLKNAINDYENSFLRTSQDKPQFYLKGLYIKQPAFINNKDKNKEYAIVSFSSHMNSIIGGRGTGKSTILNILDFMLSQNINEKSVLKNIFSYGELYLALNYLSEDYIISFEGLKQDSINSHLNTLFPDHYDKYELYYEHEKIEAQRKRKLQRYIDLYKIEDDMAFPVRNKANLLSKFYTRKYSLSNIVERLSSYENPHMSIENLIETDKILSKKIEAPEVKTDQNIIDAIHSINRNTSTLYNKKIKIVNSFNERNSNLIRLKYTHLPCKEFILNWSLLLSASIENNYKRYFKEYSIEKDMVLKYLYDVSKEIGGFQLALLILQNQYNEILNTLSLEGYIEDNEMKRINLSLENLNDKEVVICFFNELRKQLSIYSRIFNRELKRYYNNFEIWSIEFNINNKTGTNRKNEIFKDIHLLSMGQRVVALLNFILEFDSFNDNFLPLIIDQPEDHLDNQYIFYNLVHLLKKEKHKRQIIIATHNSTIVVNSSTEIVIVMNSDSDKGWIERTGFSKDKTILKDIINILEGGIEAFKMKNEVYSNSDI